MSTKEKIIIAIMATAALFFYFRWLKASADRWAKDVQAEQDGAEMDATGTRPKE